MKTHTLKNQSINRMYFDICHQKMPFFFCYMPCSLMVQGHQNDYISLPTMWLAKNSCCGKISKLVFTPPWCCLNLGTIEWVSLKLENHAVASSTDLTFSLRPKNLKSI